MACGSNCCGPAQASAAPLGSEVQVQQPSAPDPLTTPAPIAPSSLRASCDTQSMSGKGLGCCSPGKNNDLQPDACCSQQRNTTSPTSVGPETRSSSCCLKDVVVSSCVDADPKRANHAIDNSRQTLSSNIANSSPKSSCKADCCAADKKAGTTVDTLELLSSNRILEDVEKTGAGTEHVVLSISGMTCTGCETKLQRTLATLPYLSKLRTSLVLARAEFDIDHSAASVEDVIKHLARTTEFKCEQVSTQG